MSKPFTAYPVPERTHYPVVVVQWRPRASEHVCDQCNEKQTWDDNVGNPLTMCCVCGRWLCGSCWTESELCPNCEKLSIDDRGWVIDFREHLEQIV